jgi:Ca-activated chloride channel family protein
MLLLLTAAARPTAPMVVPLESGTVVLAIDVSRSMSSDDVVPSRLAAAQAAAHDFVNRLPAGVRVGVVAFSDDARLAQAPAGSREEIFFAIDSLQPQGGTAIGSGILSSLQAIFPGERLSLDEVIGVAKPKAAPIDPANAVILLTDGQNSTGPDPVDAARLAAARGVRVYTIGVGTPYGHIGDERGWRTLVGIDEEVLGDIARLTGAEYFYASTAPDLRRIYSRLGASVAMTRTPTEIGAPLCALAALAATVSASLSLFWFGRVL